MDNMKELLAKLETFQQHEQEFEEFLSTKETVIENYGESVWEKLLQHTNSFAETEAKARKQAAPKPAATKPKVAKKASATGKGFPSRDFLKTLSDEELKEKRDAAEAKHKSGKGSDRLMNMIDEIIKARSDGTEKQARAPRKERAPDAPAPNPNGIWGDAGKPSGTRDEQLTEARKRLRAKDIKPRVKTMLKNLIERLRADESIERTGKVRKVAKKAGQAHRAKRGDGAPAQAPHRQAEA